MKKTILTNFALIIALAMGFMSCQQTDSRFEGFEKNKNGMYYKFHVKGSDTAKPAISDWVTIDMIYGSEDTVIFNSNDFPDVMRLPMIEPTFKGDIYEGMSMMSVGDSATFACNADSTFKKLFRMPTIPPEFDSVEYLYFDIKMKNIETAAEAQLAQEKELARLKAEESVQRNDFLAEKYPDAKPVASGLYYIETKEGKGSNPQSGQKVKVHYTGKFLDGTVFDSSVDRGEPIEFTLGQGQVIKGWDEGIAMMRKGGKAVLVIPSEIAYGTYGRGNIPPYSTLVFDVELVDIN